MRMNRLPGYGLPEVAFWPCPRFERNTWSMYSLKLRTDGTLNWYRRYLDRGMPGHAFNDDYDNYADARKTAEDLNNNVDFDIDKLPSSQPEKESLRLKVDKALTAKTRLMDEEQMMLKEAIRRHSNDPRISLEDLILKPKGENLRQPLLDVLNEMPYLRYDFSPSLSGLPSTRRP